MKKFPIAIALVGSVWLAAAVPTAAAAPCLVVTLTGTQSGPALFNGQAGAGTLVWVRRYDLVEFAVVLEPDEPLVSARRAFFAGSPNTASRIRLRRA